MKVKEKNKNSNINMRGKKKKKSTLTWISGHTYPVRGKDILNTYLLAQGDRKKGSMTVVCGAIQAVLDRKSTRLNSSHRT